MARRARMPPAEPARPAAPRAPFRLLSSACSLLLSLVTEVYCRPPPGINMHRVLLLAQLLVPHRDRVVSRRNILPRTCPVRARDREVRMVHHSDPRVHPRVNVALHRDHHLGARELVLGVG